jgi:hypothetical protein
MRPARGPGYLKRRLASILGQHLLLFRGLGIEGGEQLEREYGRLLAFGRHPSGEQRRELVSVLAQHRLLFGDGIIAADPEAYQECSALIRLLSAEAATAPQPERGLNWDLLGLGVLRRGIALPLYGRARPEEPPRESGTLIAYAVLDTRKRALLELAALEAPRFRLAYTADGIRLAGRFQVFYLHIDTRFDAEQQAGEGRLVLSTEGGALSVGPATGRLLAPNREISPFDGRYAFFFPRQPGAQGRVVGFLEREISSRLELDFREAEAAAVAALKVLGEQYGFQIRE